MGHMNFPADVQQRLTVLETVSSVKVKAHKSVIEFVRKKNLLPKVVVQGQPLDGNSNTTAAIATYRLDPPKTNPELFKFFFDTTPTGSVPSPTFGLDNPITESFILLAYVKGGRATDPAAESALKSVIGWVEKQPKDHPLRAYPACLAARALENYQPHATTPAASDLIRQARQKLGTWAYGQVMEQVAYYHSQFFTMYEVGSLAYALLLACRESQSHIEWNSPVTKEGVRIVLSSQAEDGLWHSSKPFWHSSGRGFYLSSSQIGSALVKLLEQNPDLFRQHEGYLTKYVKWMDSNANNIEVDPDTKIYGWAVEADYTRKRVDLYVTLDNIKILSRLETAMTSLNRTDLLEKAGLNVKLRPMSWTDLKDTDARLPANQRIKARLEQLFSPGKDEKLEHFSIVLFGPAGTSKTSIAEALANFMSSRLKRPWPLITITPGDFISGGEPMAEINATNIFKVLEELGDVVILFDEIDRLLVSRKAGGANAGGALQFMTTSMLTKFQSLRDRKKSIFVLTTNEYEKLDGAIKRAGRFDGHIAVLPPDRDSRILLLRKFLQDFDTANSSGFSSRLSDSSLETLSNKTAMFIFPELKSLVLDTLHTVPATADESALVAALEGAGKTCSRAFSFKEYIERKDAAKEAVEMLCTLAEAEFKNFTDLDKNECGQLVTTLRESGNDGEIPKWLHSVAR